MQMIWHELKSNLKGLIGWTIAVIIFQLSGYSKYQGFAAAESSNSLNSITNVFPPALQALFGMSNLNIGTLIGYFGILYVYFALMGCIYSGLLGANIIAKEERDKTSEFLYTRPVSRNKALTAKVTVGNFNSVFLWAVIVISSIIGVAITNSYHFSLSGQVMQMMWGILLMQIFFFCLGMFFAGLFKRPKLPTTAITISIVGAYFLAAFADLNVSLNWLRFFTPFRWFSAPSIINTGHVALGYTVLAIIFSLVLITFGFVLFDRRDITVG